MLAANLSTFWSTHAFGILLVTNPSLWECLSLSSLTHVCFGLNACCVPSNSRYSFAEDYGNDFKKEFKEHEKTIATNSLLAKNLEFILAESRKRCKGIAQDSIKNVLLFFHSSKNKPPTKTNESFTIIPIDYTNWITGSFITLTT
jgi:hypothetical protein